MYLLMLRLVPTGVWGRGVWAEEENVVDLRLYCYSIRNGMYGSIELVLRVIV